MEKTIELSPREMQQLQAMQLEHLQLTSRYGEMMMQLEELKSRIREGQGSQRTWVQGVVSNHGIDQFSAARLEGNIIRCTVPDEEAKRMATVEKEKSRTNGSAELDKMTTDAQLRWAKEAEIVKTRWEEEEAGK